MICIGSLEQVPTGVLNHQENRQVLKFAFNLVAEHVGIGFIDLGHGNDQIEFLLG